MFALSLMCTTWNYKNTFCPSVCSVSKNTNILHILGTEHTTIFMHFLIYVYLTIRRAF